LLSALALAAFAPPAGAVPLVLTDGTNLFRTDTNDLPTPPTSVPVTGMQPGEILVGVDQRPATGQLYGIGGSSRMYVIDPLSGAATQVGTAGAFTLNGIAFGIDFNPVPDRLRHVSNTEQNLRMNPNDGTSLTDAPLNPADPNIVAEAYSNNVAGATTTTLFAIDSTAGRLRTQGSPNGSPTSPNAGTLIDVGDLGLGNSLNDAIGFDIGADGATFAAITVGGVSRLYGINTVTGNATIVGTIGNGATSFRGLAIMPARIRLAAATVNATEGSDALFEVTRNAPAAGPVSVEYTTAAGTAAIGEDYTPVFGTVSWAAGESGPKTIAVPVQADAGAEGDETFSVTISTVTGADAVLGSPTTSVATIAANEAGPTLQFTSPEATVEEGATATLEVTRVGSTQGPVSVEYTTAPGSASENDYTPVVDGLLSWAAGDGSPKTISIPIADDDTGEAAETFAVNLLNPVVGGTRGTPASVTVTIARSDGGPGPGGGSGQEPTLTLAGPKRQKLRTVRRKGLKVVASTNRACSLDASLRRGKKRIGRAKQELDGGKERLRIKVKKKQRPKLRRGQKLKVVAGCTNDAGPSPKVRRTYKLKG
jgi:hypothetical protein